MDTLNKWKPYCAHVLANYYLPKDVEKFYCELEIMKEYESNKEKDPRVAYFNAIDILVKKNYLNTDFRQILIGKLINMEWKFAADLISKYDVGPSINNSLLEIVTTKDQLSNAMLNSNFPYKIHLAKDIHMKSNTIFRDMIKEVISEVFEIVGIEKIIEYGRCLEIAEMHISYAKAVSDIMHANDDINNHEVILLASYVKAIMDSDEYKSNLASCSHAILKKIQNDLPRSVMLAVFSKKFRIKNVFWGEYLYADADEFKYDAERRNLFTWVKGDWVGEFKFELVGDYGYIKCLDFDDEYLQSASISRSIKLDSQRRHVFTSKGRDTEGKWRIEPKGSECYLKNITDHEYLYAAEDELKQRNQEKRRVFTWVKNGERIDKSVWRIEAC